MFYFFGSIQIISGLDSQSKFHMFPLFTGRHIRGPRKSSDMAAPYWALYIILCGTFWQNMSTWRQRTLNLDWELSSLFLVYNILISWLYPIHCFWLYFVLRDNKHTPLRLAAIRNILCLNSGFHISIFIAYIKWRY